MADKAGTGRPGEACGAEGNVRRVAEEKHELSSSKRTGSGREASSKQSKRRRSCPVYFGVKSYLHHFYDDGNSFKDPSLYEDDDHQYLLKPHHRRRRCTPIWWKIFMWIGVTLLIFGVIGILVGYLVPPRHVLIAQGSGSSSSSSSSSSFSPDVDSSNTAYIDERAEAYNTTLDMSKLIGLILFCVGGVTLTMALLFPSFLAHYCLDEDFYHDHGDLRDITDHEIGEGEEDGKRSWTDGSEGGEGPRIEQSGIPASAKVKEVQPTKKAGQQMLTHLPAQPQSQPPPQLQQQ